jgi:hypothetical protein
MIPTQGAILGLLLIIGVVALVLVMGLVFHMDLSGG